MIFVESVFLAATEHVPPSCIYINKYYRNGVRFTILSYITRYLLSKNVAPLELFLDLVHYLVCALKNIINRLIIRLENRHADRNGIAFPWLDLPVLICLIKGLPECLYQFIPVFVISAFKN